MPSVYAAIMVERRMNNRTDMTHDVTQSALLTEADILARAAPPQPRKCGIYFLINEGKLMYIGQSINIDARLPGHDWRKYDAWTWVSCDRRELHKLERRYIDQFLPPWNEDKRTTYLRPREPIPIDAPLEPLPLEGIDEAVLKEWRRETQEYLDTHVTEYDVKAEWMRRVRATKTGASMKDFGPMPKVGDPFTRPIKPAMF